MIEILEGVDIFESPANSIVIPVNCVGVMGKGLALQYKNKDHSGFMIYKDYCDRGKMKIGCPVIVSCSYRSHNVIFFPTKNHWRENSKLEYIISGLTNLQLDGWNSPHKYIALESISFPKIGCGEGKLDWDKQVKPLIFAILGMTNKKIYLHE